MTRKKSNVESHNQTGNGSLPGAKPFMLTVALTTEQMEIVQRLAYHMRATPEDTLCAMAWAHVVTLFDEDMNDREEILNLALREYVSARRLFDRSHFESYFEDSTKA